MLKKAHLRKPQLSQELLSLAIDIEKIHHLKSLLKRLYDLNLKNLQEKFTQILQYEKLEKNEKV